MWDCWDIPLFDKRISFDGAKMEEMEEVALSRARDGGSLVLAGGELESGYKLNALNI